MRTKKNDAIQLSIDDTVEPMTVQQLREIIDEKLNQLVSIKIRLTEMKDNLNVLPDDGNFAFEFYNPVTFHKGLQIKLSV